MYWITPTMFPPKKAEIDKLCDDFDCDEDKKPMECKNDDTTSLPN